MKDIEAGLKAGASADLRRGLSAGFTDRVMAAVEVRERRSMFGRIASGWKGFAMHKLANQLTKPIGLTLGVLAVIITAGTGYAAIQWMRPDVKLDTAYGIEMLSNGNKRFWVEFGECQGQHMGPHRSYYEIKAGSKLTPEMLVQGLTVSCEYDLLTELFPDIYPEATRKDGYTFKAYQDQYYTPYAQISRVTDHALYINVGLNGNQYNDVRVPLDKGAEFYEKGQRIKLSELRSGDWVTLVAHTDKLDKPFSTETMTPDKLSSIMKDGLPIGATVRGAIKHEANPYDVLSIERFMGTEWTRLVEDKSAPDGWSQLVPLDKN